MLKFILTQAVKPPKGTTNDAGARSAAIQPAKVAAPAPPPVAKVAPVQVNVQAAPPAQDGTPDNNSLVPRALEIIAEQSGVAIADLRDDIRFDDIGIDSLLSLMITSLFTEELGIEADPSLFLENDTVADIKKFFGAKHSADTHVKVNIAPAQNTDAVVTAQPQQQIQMVSQGASQVSSASISGGDDPRWADILNIISEETSIAPAKLTDDVSFADIGVDSLLSLMIGSRLREELDIDVDTSSLLTSLDAVRALREALFPAVSPSSPPSSNSDASGYTSPRERSDPATPESEIAIPAASVPVPPTTSVVLQGNPRTCSRTLFFFPDGSGLASSYISIPRIADDLVVYGLNSPFLKKGAEMKCTWDEMVASYIAEIRRRQPSGPYSFAGWSAGGILGFRASQVLMEAGEVVRDLIILDSPVPENLEILPEHFFEYCSTSGLFGGQDGAPEWLITHFRNINRVLSSYYAEPMKVSTLRKVNILWACESAVDDTFQHKPDDPKQMAFLTSKRTDFTAGGWIRLFPNLPIQVDRAMGVHHWTLLKGDSAVRVAAYIADILA